jgi:EAL domain-containing protein (putative c-di-GMP-specific phosphodiesterase class I)/GGDEF domain-containing protein
MTQWWVNIPEWETVLGMLVGATILALLLSYRGRQRSQSFKNAAELKAFKKTCQTAEETVIIVDRTYRVVFANTAAKMLYPLEKGQNLKEITKKAFRYYNPEDRGWLPLDELIHRHRKRKTENPTLFTKLQLYKENSGQVQVKVSSIKSEDNQHMDIVVVRDTSCEQSLINLQNTNSFSGLPNRYKAFADIGSRITNSTRKTRFAVIVLEMDNVSRLRGAFGCNEMERILSHIANTIQELEEEGNIRGYHFAYSTFVLLLDQPKDIHSIHLTISRFGKLVEQAKSTAKDFYQLSFSSGASLFPEYATVNDLLNSAFAALAKAQEKGSGHTVIAQKDKLLHSDAILTISREIKEGLKNREFKLYFQPIFSGRDLRLAGAEVLLRWKHIEGMRHPGMFIPFAEKSGLIIDIGYYVLEETLRMLTRWNHSGFMPIQLNINLSLRELESIEFMNHLNQILYQYDIGASGIKYEITEYASMHNPILTKERLEKLYQMGIKIALDDFGTGYSSFSHLAEFPIDTLKIDKSFVDNMIQNRNKQHIISSITKLGHSLGMNLVAEGIETRDQAKLLQQMGVDLFQGYYFAKPMSQLEFQYLLTHPEEQKITV